MRGTSNILLSKNAVETNVNFVRQKIGSDIRISAVVKANAYGHGIEHMVPLFEQNGIDHFSVFDYTEAMRVRLVTKSNCDIMIMGWISDEDIRDTLVQGFEFFVFNPKRLKLAVNHAKELQCKAKVHLEIETGMNRVGLLKEEIEEVVEIIQENKKHIEIKGLCTHLAGPESISNYKRIIRQLKKYNAVLSNMKSLSIVPDYRHAACSAGAFNYSKARFDLVRIGIMLYGFWPSNESLILYVQNRKDKSDPLKRVITWKSKVMSVNHIGEGEFVGYGVSYLTQRDISTAIIPIGYSMGYNRSLSNKGRILIHGHSCDIIGVINMNMIIANITDVPDVKIGDEVVIIGNQGDQEIKVSAFTNYSDELNYEVLAHLPENIKREVVN
ncbi:MAG: alanine racemase [Cytophagales bacterium]